MDRVMEIEKKRVVLTLKLVLLVWLTGFTLVLIFVSELLSEVIEGGVIEGAQMLWGSYEIATIYLSDAWEIVKSQLPAVRFVRLLVVVLLLLLWWRVAYLLTKTIGKRRQEIDKYQKK